MSTNSKLSISPETKATASRLARIFFLDLGAGRVLSANPDGSDLKTLVSEGRKLPDGLAADAFVRGHLYWTNMGNPKARRRDHLPLRSRRPEHDDDRCSG